MDELKRGINEDQDVRVVAAVTSDLTADACRRHDLKGAEALVLGRALTAGCLLATLTKSKQERVRVNIRGDGTVGRVLVDARADGRVRGCIEKRPADPTAIAANGTRPNISPLVGTAGHIVVTRDVGLEQEYQGVVEIKSGEIDEDLERYLGESEQLPSLLRCEVILDANNEVLRSAGVLCQTFPGAGAGRLDKIRDNLCGGAFRDLLRQDRTTTDLMGFALLGEGYAAMSAVRLQFQCTCGPDRAISVISTLGADDVASLADEPGDTEIRCSFCGSTYALKPSQLLALATSLRRQRS